MSSMDALRSRLSEVEDTLRDVIGRLNAIEGKAPTAQAVPPIAVTLPETKLASPVATKPVTGASGMVTRKP